MQERKKCCVRMHSLFYAVSLSLFLFSLNRMILMPQFKCIKCDYIMHPNCYGLRCYFYAFSTYRPERITQPIQWHFTEIPIETDHMNEHFYFYQKRALFFWFKSRKVDLCSKLNTLTNKLSNLNSRYYSWNSKSTGNKKKRTVEL